MKDGLYLITKERNEQIMKHGFDASHDDKSPGHCSGELVGAAIYLLAQVPKGRSLGGGQIHGIKNTRTSLIAKTGSIN